MSSQSDTNPEPQGTPLPVEWLDFVQVDSALAAALGAPVDELSDDELALRLRVLGADADLSDGPQDSGLLASRNERIAALRRAAAQVRAFETLAPKAAPSELEGLVVASMNSGARQERVVQQLRALGAQVAPRDLDEAVARLVIGDRLADSPGSRFRAPAVLDRLVEESLADPAKAAAKSMTSRLGREGAPDELAGRVESQLQNVDHEEPVGALGLEPRRVVAALVSMGLAIALVVTIGILGNQEPVSDSTDDAQAASEEMALAVDETEDADSLGVRLEVVMLDEDSLTDEDRNMLRLLGGAL